MTYVLFILFTVYGKGPHDMIEQTLLSGFRFKKKSTILLRSLVYIYLNCLL